MLRSCSRGHTEANIGNAAGRAEKKAVRHAAKTEGPSTWFPVPLSGDGASIEPTILHRSDGVPLLYPGRLHVFQGESESCKTWGAYVAVAEQVQANNHVVILDFEDDANNANSRLLALGLAQASITNYVHFTHPDEPITDRFGVTESRGAHDLSGEIVAHKPALVVLDGVTEAMALEGLDPLSNSDVARWYNALPNKITTLGPAVVLIDHVVKSKEQRGRYALGGVHKLNGLTGASYTFEAIEPFAPGHTGRIKVTVGKDRPGYVRGHSFERKHVGVLTLTSGDGGSVTCRFEPPEQRAEGGFVPHGLMAKISAHLSMYDGATKTDLRALGKAEHVDAAIKELVGTDHVKVTKEGRSYRHYLLTPYPDGLNWPE